MALDPEEVVTLTDHGTMTLRSAVARAMMLPPQERDQASIVRDSEPSILDFHLIRHLATRWDGGPHALSDSEMAIGAFYLRRAGMALATQDDITVFDSATVVDRATYENPHRYPLGISTVIVNGVVVVDAGQHTGALPGRVLRRGPAGVA